jgi:desulfoferrodoxin-like iron-binding protein
MATERLQVYRCGTCGSLLEVLTGGPGAMSCCGLPMQRVRAPKPASEVEADESWARECCDVRSPWEGQFR